MARKQRKPVPDEEIEEDLIISDEPPEINPYMILDLEETATTKEIKSAYRRQALIHHPDKAAEADKEAAHTRFQEIAFAYAVLSDEKRRQRYDATGRTDESIDDGDFDWRTFYRELYENAITTEKIEAFEKEYKGNDEEKRDVLAAYEKVKGNMGRLYQVVMLSDPANDEDRFRGIIDAAIADGEVEAYEKYTGESLKSRERRVADAKKRAREEAAEAEETSKELSSDKSGKKKKDDMSDLAALIQQRQKGRQANFFDNLEAKYGGGQKRSRDEPSEEAFAKNRKQAKKAKP